MKTLPLFSGRERLSSPAKLITREEYDIIMSEVSTLEAGLKEVETPVPIEERVRKLEFCMFILVGFVLIFIALSRTG